MKIHHISITVNNLNESIRFYQDFFGFQILKFFERKDMNGKAVFLKLGDFLIELWEFEDILLNKDDLDNIKIRGMRHIAFEVRNLDKIVSDFKQRKLPVTNPKIGASGNKYSFTNDPNGIALELYQK